MHVASGPLHILCCWLPGSVCVSGGPSTAATVCLYDFWGPDISVYSCLNQQPCVACCASLDLYARLLCEPCTCNHCSGRTVLPVRSVCLYGPCCVIATASLSGLYLLLLRALVRRSPARVSPCMPLLVWHAQIASDPHCPISCAFQPMLSETSHPC